MIGISKDEPSPWKVSNRLYLLTSYEVAKGDGSPRAQLENWLEIWALPRQSRDRRYIVSMNDGALYAFEVRKPTIPAWEIT